jgi:cytochrome c-type biogenesis protein CcmH/NrfG
LAPVNASDSQPAAAPAAGRASRGGLSGRSLAIIVAVWIAVAGGALGIAAALNKEPQKPVTLVAAPPQGLPVLRLYLDRGLPAEVARLKTGDAQAARLQKLATARNDPALWVDLAAFAQRVGDLNFAEAAFQQALALDPTRLDAKVGLLMVDGATGSKGLARAAKGLGALESDNPTSQLVAFNSGMVAIYRGDRAAARDRFGRTVTLGPATTLGKLARQFTSASTPSATP